MSRRTRPLRAVLGTAFCLALVPPAAAQDLVRAAPADWLSACDVGGESAWCGTYEVWENREARSGRRIGLNVVVLPARTSPAAPDALVWLDGGPGAAATESGPGLAGAFAAARETRDMLLVDQRGTGRSHPLDCPGPSADAPLLSNGMFLTVTCSEDLRFLTEEEIRRETDGTFMGDYRVRRQLAACEIWGRGDIDESYSAPVTVDVPTLLISGEFDTATPVAGATWVAEHLPNALHLIVPNESHGFANPACEIDVVNGFIVNGGEEGLDYACISETRRPLFVTGGSR